MDNDIGRDCEHYGFQGGISAGDGAHYHYHAGTNNLLFRGDGKDIVRCHPASLTVTLAGKFGVQVGGWNFSGAYTLGYDTTAASVYNGATAIPFQKSLYSHGYGFGDQWDARGISLYRNGAGVYFVQVAWVIVRPPHSGTWELLSCWTLANPSGPIGTYAQHGTFSYNCPTGTSDGITGIVVSA